jgi:hypothetical protein
MNKRRYMLLLVLLMAGFLGGVVSDNFFTPAPAQAQLSEESKTAAGRKWEYCALTKAAYVGSVRGGLYWISYFRDAGVQVVEVEEAATERNGPAKIIAKLGEEGWEMVGQGQLEIRQGGLAALYFKRPKQ